MHQPEDSLDIRRLQRELSGHHPVVESATLVECSPPQPPGDSRVQIPVTPTRLPKQVSQIIDAHHGNGDDSSNDRTLNFQFFGSNSIPSSQQGELEDTQVDPAYLQEFTPGGINSAVKNSLPRDSQLEDTQPTAPTPPDHHEVEVEAEVDDDILRVEDEPRITFFPEANRFKSLAAMQSSPVKGGYNPLAQFGMGGGAGDFSLTQAFNEGSSPLRSPARPRTGSSIQMPQTPSFAKGIMARSMHTAAMIPKESPRSQISPHWSKSTSEPPELPGTRSKSPEPGILRATPARRTLSKISDASRDTPRARSLSPVFSSPPVRDGTRKRRLPIRIEPDDDDDCFAITKSQEMRERAEKARRKGVEELRNFVRKPKSEASLKPQTAETPPRKSPLKPPKQRERKKKPAESSSEDEKLQSSKKRIKSAQHVPPPEEAASETEDDSIPLSFSVPIPPQEAATQVLASDPIQPPEKPDPPTLKPQPQTTDIDEEWERLHNFPEPLPLKRRARSMSCLRNELQQEPEMEQLSKAKTDPPQLENPLSALRKGTSMMPASLKEMAPFNIPLSPPQTTDRRSSQVSPTKKMPDFVKESSGLVPPSQQQSLTPHATSSAEASPSRKNALDNNNNNSTTRGADVPKTPFPAQRLTSLRMHNGNTTIPETSPWDKGGMLSPMTVQQAPQQTTEARPQTEHATPVRKRKRRSTEVLEKTILPPTEALVPTFRSFASIDNATPFLSSREEPDEVDMIDMLRNVGAGNQPDLELPDPAPRATKRRKPSEEKEAAAAEEPAEEKETQKDESTDKDQTYPESPALPVLPPSVPLRGKALGKRARGKLANVANTVASAGKALARKATKTTARKAQPRSSISRASESRATTQTITQETPTPAIRTADETVSPDILSTLNPAFHISTPKTTANPSKRVFALFKDVKLQYHPATILDHESPTTIRVVFDDGTEDVLERHQIRSLDLREGDVIKVDLPNMKKGAWVIKAFQEPPVRSCSDGEPVAPAFESYTAKHTDIQGRYYVYVEPKKPGQDGISSVQISVTKIYLTKSLWNQFAPRDGFSSKLQLQIPLSGVSFRTRSPSISTPGGITPSTSIRRTGTPTFFSNTNTPVARHSLFATMIFALSFGEKELEKRTVTDRIKANGGRIIETGFNELFHDVDSSNSDTYSTHSRETSLAPSETGAFSLKPEGHRVGFAAVIADRHSRRTKFLQALALGLPCIAYKWIEDCVKKSRIMDWRPYLLPAGDSAYLNGAVHSRILEPFEAGTARLSDIFENRTRPMNRWNVLFVTKQASEKRKAFTFLLHALGAESVTKVKTLDAASKLIGKSTPQTQEQKYDCVLTATADRDKAMKMWKVHIVRSLKVMDEEQLVQSLILGSLVVDL